MRSLEAVFSKKENGWVAETTITGNTQLDILLEKRGRVAVRRTLNGHSPTVLCTRHDGPLFFITLTGDTKERDITIVTSEKPKHIYYANI